MRSFVAVVISILFALLCSASSFILPASSARQRPSADGSRLFESSASRRENELIVSILEDGEDDESWDPSDTFNGQEESSESNLQDGDVVLKKQNKSFDNDQSVKSIIRDLDGCPLSTEYFARTMGVKNVESYTCPEKDAFRGFMSNGCRVQLLPGGETAFYKRIVFEHLGHAWEKMKHDPFKLVRDSKSYQVVASFLSSKACQKLTEKTGVHIPKCYDAKLHPNDLDPIESKFSFLLEDLHPSDGWYQQWLIDDVTECKTTLSAYAKIHAFFWAGSSFWNDDDNDGAAEEFEEGVWKSGSYVQPKAQNPNQCKMVAKEWMAKRMKFEKQLSPLDYWDNLGERLESICEECGRHAHPFAYDDEINEQYQKYRTFTHGDPKQANLFFRKKNSKLVEVGLIDFQWAGFGLAASDIAHFLTSAVHADRLVDGGEDQLRQYYFDELQNYLVEYGAFDNADDAIANYTYDTFVTQYDTAVLDICRLVIAYTWDRFEEPVEKDDKAGCARTMNKTSYNKSIPNAIWLMSKCDEIMKSRGV